MTPDRALSEPERLVRDALFRDELRQPEQVYTQRARDLVAALRPLLAAEPEIVTGEQASDLPVGSRIVECDENGTPLLGRHVRVAADAIGGLRYLVHRAPAPAPKVGDVVRSEAELDRLPVNAALRVGKPGGLLVTKIGPGKFVNGGWSIDVQDALDVGVLVLDLGSDS